jgi:hypothetical protein
MKRCLRFFVLIFALSASVVLRADTDAEVSARKDALELAGAFGNDGFKIRDGHSCGLLKPHDHALIAVNLYAGNQYWFSVGTAEPLKKLPLAFMTKRETNDHGNFSEGTKPRQASHRRSAVSTLYRSIRSRTRRQFLSRLFV